MGAAPAAVSESKPEDGHRSRGARRSSCLDPLGAGAGAREGRRAALPSRPGQRLGVGAVVADRAERCARWTISETSQLGQSQCRPQERQVSQGDEAAAVDHHDRLGAAAAHLAQAPPRSARAAGPSAGRPSAYRAPRPGAGGGRRPGEPVRSGAAETRTSGRGVAVPASSTAPRSAARWRATARAS